MLYKLEKRQNVFDSITPLPFSGLPREKHLEDLIAKNLWEVLFEGNELMPLSQERAWQPEADIYALNKRGDLVIFELKREHADAGAVHQALRYCEKASQFQYGKLEGMLQNYLGRPDANLQEEHRAAFDLEQPLSKSAFNQRQHLFVVGSACDEGLVHNVSYWKSRGLSIEFLPYRVYKIAGEYYFEFFSLPYDRHSNPAYARGLIFDTNLSYDPDAIWYMCEKNRVAAFGDRKGVIHYLRKNDVVFLYHKSQGIVAVGKITTSKVMEDVDADALYHELEWLTSKPTKGTPIKGMPAWRIKEVLDHGFFWATTMKKPYLSNDEVKTLVEAFANEIDKRA